MRPHLDTGNAFIMVGIANCFGILEVARSDGYEVAAAG
jgi:hypothetical protein